MVHVPAFDHLEKVTLWLREQSLFVGKIFETDAAYGGFVLAFTGLQMFVNYFDLPLSDRILDENVNLRTLTLHSLHSYIGNGSVIHSDLDAVDCYLLRIVIVHIILMP